VARTVVEAAEELLDQPIPVLDHGFVRLVDYCGGDQRVVQSARVSYGAGTKSFRQDRGLIHYLLRNEHTSPFEQVSLTFHAKMPMFVARQWVRHRTARLNEISARYSVMKDEFYLPSADQLRFQSQDNKQGRSEEALPLEQAEEVRAQMKALQNKAYAEYLEMIEAGVAREIARIHLPVSLYTEWYWQIDLHNLFHFLKLRMDPHAQYEIRVYAEAMARCAQAVAPSCFEAFEQHQLRSLRFSKDELAALSAVLSGGEHGLEGRAQVIFEEKLARMRESVRDTEPVDPDLPPPSA
jgi:thymidylate synthase (FAD)